MPQKCTVPGCRTGYDATSRFKNDLPISTYRFPSDPERCRKWKVSEGLDLALDPNISYENISRKYLVTMYFKKFT